MSEREITTRTTEASYHWTDCMGGITTEIVQEPFREVFEVDDPELSRRMVGGKARA